MIVGILEKV